MMRDLDVTIADEDFLQLLLGLNIDFECEIDTARNTYEAVSAEIPDHPSLEALITDGWMRVVWERIYAPLGMSRAVNPTGPMAGLAVFMAKRHGETFHFSSAVSNAPHLAGLASTMVQENGLPRGAACQTPEWVAARLWDRSIADSIDLPAALRLWTDRWKVMGAPNLVPSQVWAAEAADAFRSTTMKVLESVAGLPNWDETREHIISGLMLAHSQPRSNFDRYIPPVPASTVGRALWLLNYRLERSLVENLAASEDASALMHLLLADVEASELSVAPNSLASQLFPVMVEQPDLFFSFLLTIEHHPLLLADLLFCPQTSVLACLLIARWQGPHGAWETELRLRDFHAAKASAFADAAFVMAHFLKIGFVSPSEVAAFLEWLHSDPGAIDGSGDGNLHSMLATLRGELFGQEGKILTAIAGALVPSASCPALQTPVFAAALDVIDIGNLAASTNPEPFIAAYTNGIAGGEYSLTVHRITQSAATALYALASRSSAEKRHSFLFPLRIRDRLVTSTEDNPYTLADNIARSVRAHIRVLSRIVAGLSDTPPEDLIDALVFALRAGAVEHKEKGRIAAFAPRLENGFGFKSQDRPIAADIGDALSALQGNDRDRVLAALFETDEPLILAQLMPLSPRSARDPISRRIAEISPSDAGEIHSLTEAQARVDHLLAADLPDSAALFMDNERNLKTFGKIPGRTLTRLHADLRLMLLRSDWDGLNAIQIPADLSQHDHSSASDTIEFFRAIAQMKKPGGDLVGAAETFARLAHRRSDVPAYKVNLLATRIGLLLGSNGFSALSGAELAQGRRLLTDAEALTAAAQSPGDAEIVAVNRALLLLAVGKPAAALPVLSAIRSDGLRPAAAAYSAVALARLGRDVEAASALSTAESSFGIVEVLRAARDYLTNGASFPAFATPSLEDDPLPRVKTAWLDFLLMDHERQAQVLNPEASPFAELVTGHVRAAAETIVGLVPMMKDVAIDSSEDDLTAFIQHLLAARIAFLGWTITDQSRGGFMAKENPGERDLKLSKGTTTLAVMEAVICNRPVTQEWARGELTSHFQKLFAYATCALFFHLTYAYIENVESIVANLRAAAQHEVPGGFTYLDCIDIPLTDARPTGLIARYRGEFGEVRVVFLVLNLGQHAQKAAAKLANSSNPRNKRAIC